MATRRRRRRRLIRRRNQPTIKGLDTEGEVNRNGTYNRKYKRELYMAVRNSQMSNCINPQQNQEEHHKKINSEIFEKMGGLGRAVGRQLRTVSQDLLKFDSRLSSLEKFVKERKKRKKGETTEETSKESSNNQLRRKENLLRGRKRQDKEETAEETYEESSVTYEESPKELNTGESSEATYSF